MDSELAAAAAATPLTSGGEVLGAVLEYTTLGWGCEVLELNLNQPASMLRFVVGKSLQVYGRLRKNQESKVLFRVVVCLFKFVHKTCP